ncbi:MAG: methyltransferase family protein [Actinomycetota bacterium]
MDRRDWVVAAQLGSLAGIAWPGRARWRLPAAAATAAGALTVAGAALSLAAAAAHGRRLTPRVTPPREAELLTGGPYRVSRHPIYAGLLLASGGVAVLRRRPEPLLAWTALAAVLHVKAGMEETALRARFGRDYESYATRTPRLLGRPGR